MDNTRVARALAWFGIGLGLIEVSAPKRLGRLIGLEEHAARIRIYGAREIASGVLVLVAERPDSRLWIRSLGDVLDGLLLMEGMRRDNDLRQRAIIATVAVTPVVVLDLLYTVRAALT